MAAAIMMLTASAVPVHQDMGANLVKQVSVLEVISWGDWHCGKKVACTVELHVYVQYIHGNVPLK